MTELVDFPRIKKIIEKTSDLLEYKEKAPMLIRNKIRAFQDPEEELKLSYTQKSKYFTPESDVVLLCFTDEFKYGSWAKIKRALRRHQKCRFDHLLISRTEQEIQKRVDILVKAIEKENQEALNNKDKLNANDKEIEEAKEFDFNPEEVELSPNCLEFSENKRMKKDKFALPEDEPMEEENSV